MNFRFFSFNLYASFGLSALYSASAATTILTTDFDSLATGVVTASTLDTVTTGGTWNLNTTRGATYTIDDDGGDKAIQADDLAGNAGRIDFFEIGLNSPVAISATSVATVDFTTAARRTGSSKALTYEFLDSSGGILARILWANSGAVNLNAGGSQGSAPFFFTAAWDADGTGIRDVSISFDGTNAILDFNGVTGTVPLLLASTDLETIRVSSDFNAAAAKGVFFDNLEVSVVPEPSAALLGLCGLAVFFRRRR